MRYNNCVSGEGNWTNRLQLREKLGALKPEFAFAGSMTRGPISRPATHSWPEEPVFGRRIDAISTKINGWLGVEMFVPGTHRTSQLATLRRLVPTPYTGRICRFHPAAWHRQQLCFLAVLLFEYSCGIWWSARVFLFGWRWCLEFCRQMVHWSSYTISCRTTGQTMWQDITFRTGHPGPHVSLWWNADDWQSCPSPSATSVSTDTSRLYHPGHSPRLVFLFLRQWSITFRKFSKN